MSIDRDMTVSQIATAWPATIRVFQEHGLDFCCGGNVPLAEACAAEAIDADALLAELRAARSTDADTRNWGEAPLGELIEHIQRRYHEPLRVELPRLAAMLHKVADRHGERLPATLPPLEVTFERLRRELLHHMHTEDRLVFPAIAALEAGDARGVESKLWTSIGEPIQAMEEEHEAAAAALESMREITNGYRPPDDACPTFRGLYHGLAELERDMHVHVHLENNILFPRAARLARESTG